MMEATCSSDVSVLTRATRRHITEYDILHTKGKSTVGSQYQRKLAKTVTEGISVCVTVTMYSPALPDLS
jgi:hypothetical protein